MKIPTPAQVRKSLVYVATAAGLVIATGLLHGTAENAVNAVILALGGIGVYGAHNAPWGTPPVQ